MTKHIIYPPGAWALLARQWERSLRAENKSHNTIHAYVQSLRLFGEWAHRQSPNVQPTEVTSAHVQDFIAELLDRTSPGNAHTNYRGLRTFWKWMVTEEEIEHSPMIRGHGSWTTRSPSPCPTTRDWTGCPSPSWSTCGRQLAAEPYWPSADWLTSPTSATTGPNSPSALWWLTRSGLVGAA